MINFIPVAILFVLASLTVRAQDTNTDDLASFIQENLPKVEQFILFNHCRPMALDVERLSKDAKKIGLSQESIQSTVESRLRSARLYDSNALDNYLFVGVNVVGHAFNITLRYKKSVTDNLSGHTGFATTWDNGDSIGFSNNAAYILSNVSQAMDQFLVLFLRVNETACNNN